HYTTATAEGAAYLQHWGVPASDISVTGIPIHPAFAKPRDRVACLKSQGLSGDRPIVLQSAGGFGVGPIAKLYKGLLAIDRPLENGAAIKINNLPTLSLKLNELLANPQRLETLKANARRIAKPQAAYDVARRAMALANGAGSTTS